MDPALFAGGFLKPIGEADFARVGAAIGLEDLPVRCLRLGHGGEQQDQQAGKKSFHFEFLLLSIR